MPFLFLGKLIGFIAGFLVSGPIGAVCGFLVGHYFDRGVSQTVSRQRQTEKIRKVFFRSTFAFLGFMAKLDGRVSAAEIRRAETIMLRLNLNAAQRKEAIAWFKFGKQPEFNLRKELTQFYMLCQKHRDLLEMFLMFQMDMAVIDVLLPQQAQVLKNIANTFGIRRIKFDALLYRAKAEAAMDERARAYSSDTHWRTQHNHTHRQERARAHAPPPQSSMTQLEEAYAVLGVEASASPEHIKKTYRKRISQFHPDKLAAKGLDPSLINYAKEKAQKINVAYDYIRKTRGF